MSFLERYQQFRDKQKFIERLKTNRMLQTTIETNENDTKTIEVLREVFDNNHLAYDRRSFELASEIITQCQEQNMSAYKAARAICQELEIDMRFNVSAIEIALKTNNILK
jgi:hypothetical protein